MISWKSAFGICFIKGFGDWDFGRDRRPPYRQKCTQDKAFHTTFATQLRRRRAATQQLRPATQQLRPATQQVPPATQQLRPATQQLRPAMAQRRPATRERRLATQRRRSAARAACSTVFATAGKFSMVRNVLPERGKLLTTAQCSSSISSVS